MINGIFGYDEISMTILNDEWVEELGNNLHRKLHFLILPIPT